MINWNHRIYFPSDLFSLQFSRKKTSFILSTINQNQHPHDTSKSSLNSCSKKDSGTFQCSTNLRIYGRWREKKASNLSQSRQDTKIDYRWGKKKRELWCDRSHDLSCRYISLEIVVTVGYAHVIRISSPTKNIWKHNVTCKSVIPCSNKSAYNQRQKILWNIGVVFLNFLPTKNMHEEIKTFSRSPFNVQPGVSHAKSIDGISTFSLSLFRERKIHLLTAMPRPTDLASPMGRESELGKQKRGRPARQFFRPSVLTIISSLTFFFLL